MPMPRCQIPILIVAGFSSRLPRYTDEREEGGRVLLSLLFKVFVPALRSQRYSSLDCHEAADLPSLQACSLVSRAPHLG
jgi:hypothetical protein